MDKESMMNEAVERMHLLGLLDLPEESVIREFQENHEVFVSRPLNLGEPVGVLYKLSDAEKRLVEKIEKTEKILIYHVIRNETNVGVMYAMLSVSRYEGDWKTERKALENMEAEVVYPLAYVWNVGMGEEDLLEGFGEWGTIAISGGEGGLCQIFGSWKKE